MQVGAHRGKRGSSRTMHPWRHLAWLCALALAFSARVGEASAQGEEPYPSRLIRIVMPLPAGGNADALARLVGDKLAQAWGQPVIVENKPGATGTIGAAAVAQAKPDGYAVLITIASTIQAVGLQKTPVFKLADLLPVAKLAEAPTGFGVSTKLDVSTLAGFVELARKKPGTLSYASFGTSSTGHLLGEMLARSGGIQLVHVPYKGEAPAIADLLAGQVSAAFGSVGGLGQHRDAIRLLAITGPHRLKNYPAVPTFDEAGFPLDGLTGWVGLFVPAATPRSVVDKLAAEMRRIVSLPDVQARIVDFGFEPVAAGGQPFAVFVHEQAKRWAAAAKSVGIEPQ